MTSTGIERRIRIAGILIVLGLSMELISLMWSHPTAFLLFLFVGAVLIAAGLLYYLYSLIAREKEIEKKAVGQT